MSWIDSIKEFEPYNEQEIEDKAAILNYINMFDDILKRENEMMHITSSGIVINKNKDKMLMVHHNIFNAWSLPGGHADGEEDLLGVAMSEVREETGLKDINPITEKIFALDILPVYSHFRKEKFVKSHLHLSVLYIFEADEKEQVIIKPDENSDVKWIPFTEIDIYSNELHMKKIYNKVIFKIKNLL